MKSVTLSQLANARIFVASLVAAMAVAFIAGCSSNSEDDAQSKCPTQVSAVSDVVSKVPAMKDAKPEYHLPDGCNQVVISLSALDSPIDPNSDEAEQLFDMCKTATDGSNASVIVESGDGTDVATPESDDTTRPVKCRPAVRDQIKATAGAVDCPTPQGAIDALRGASPEIVDGHMYYYSCSISGRTKLSLSDKSEAVGLCNAAAQKVATSLSSTPTAQVRSLALTTDAAEPRLIAATVFENNQSSGCQASPEGE